MRGTSVSAKTDESALCLSAKQETQADTSLLIEELRHRYKKSGLPVEVDFRSLVRWVKLGDQQTHQIHPYPAKLLPNIAHFFINSATFRGKKSSVLDPFCGSGTVALEASLAGCTPLVADANPLALLVAQVKTTPYDPKSLRALLKEISSRAKRFRSAPRIPIVNEDLWYDKRIKLDLEKILRSIRAVGDPQHQDFFLVCFSVVARRLSYADPRISVPVRLKKKDNFSPAILADISARLKWIKKANVSEEFAKACEANIQRVEKANESHPKRIGAIKVGTDARQLLSPTKRKKPLENESVPLIITSPPYGSAQKYIRATSLSLNWLGFANPAELKALESRSIGREHVPMYEESYGIEKIAEPYQSMLTRIEKINPTRARITKVYLIEMAHALEELVRVMAKGGRLVLVSGNNQVCGEPLRNDEYFMHVLLKLGLVLDISLIDHIKSRGLMTKRNKTASVISRESVLVFSKPK